MNCDDARLLDGLCFDLILSDAPRGDNRGLIANVANGTPPYSPEEQETNQINVNVNDLSMTRGLHEARSQFVNGFLKPGNFFRCRTDGGPRNKREDNCAIVTKTINNPLKKSVPYFESYRSKIGLLCLHGISPAVWENEDKWCVKPVGVGDVLMPSDTLLGFDNLPFFVVRRSFTGIELQKITRSSKRDPGWNIDLVNRCLSWIDKQTTVLRGNNWPDVWSPEKIAERAKQDGGFYANDRAPTIETFDIYAYEESDKKAGWVRRIILDSWGTPTATGVNYNLDRNADMKDLSPDKDSDFLFNSGTRKVGQSWQNIISFQFADLSAVAPFRYHSVRSLGFLLYAVCHLQNRLRCKFNEALFEQLMMLFRVKSLDDVQRALKLDMVNKGFIDEGIAIVPAAERWQPRMDIVELGLQQNSELIGASTGAFAQRRNFSKDKVEKTRFQVMAEVNADTALISSALMQAYQYQNFEDAEIFRRFLKKNSTDPDVRDFRASVIRQGVPEKLLIPEAWEIEHERVMGGGNKTQEMTIAQQLVEMRPMFDPQPQRKILHDVVLAITDDAAKADELVPEMPVTSDSVHDTELAFGALMQGGSVTPKSGLNAVEVAGTIIRLMAQKLKTLSGPSDLMGLQACAQYAGQYIQILAEDKTQKPIVKKLSEALKLIMNQLQQIAQQQQKAQEQAAQQNGSGGLDPKDAAKIQAIMMQAQVKAQNAKTSHADRTAQKRISFQEKLKQDKERHSLDIAMDKRKLSAEVAAKDLTTAAEIGRNRLRSLGGDKE